MTVEQLISELQHFDPKAPVHIKYPSGDYWKTECVPEITCVNEEQVKYSSYHRKDVINNGMDEEDENINEERGLVITLS